MTDVAAQLLHGLQTIAHRQPRPRPFIDIGSLPWDDAAFSRHFLRTATRSQRYTHREIASWKHVSCTLTASAFWTLLAGVGVTAWRWLDAARW